jgi:AhpC/TSA family
MKLVALTLSLALAGCAAAPAVATRDTRAHAPDFSLTDTEGHTVALHDLLKRGSVILVFFPAAFSPG